MRSYEDIDYDAWKTASPYEYERDICEDDYGYAISTADSFYISSKEYGNISETLYYESAIELVKGFLKTAETEMEDENGCVIKAGEKYFDDDGFIVSIESLEEMLVKDIVVDAIERSIDELEEYIA